MAEKAANSLLPIIPTELPYYVEFRDVYSLTDYIWAWRAPVFSVARWRLFHVASGQWNTITPITEDHIDYLAEHFDLIEFGELDICGRWKEFMKMPPARWHRIRVRMEGIKKFPFKGWSPKSDYPQRRYEACGVC